MRTMIRPGKLLLLVVAVVLASFAGWALLDQAHEPREVAFMGAIFVLAAVLWTTEALPLFATALLVIGLQIILLANPGKWAGLGFSRGISPGYQEIIAAAVDPVLLLFFGGFLLARAATKEGVDRTLSALFLRPFGRRPAALLFGVMIITAVFSMWMSNTATTAMMLAVIGPVLVAVPADAPLRKTLLLGVPFAANIGGVATPIGSPPNLVAMGFLQNAGLQLDFLEWMVVGLPLTLMLLGFAWWLLLFSFKPAPDLVPLELQTPLPTARGWLVIATFTVTVLLWLTDRMLGLPASVVALIPAVVFTATGLIDSTDLKSLDWDVLLLIGGGISLGAGMQMTGLDKVIVGWLPVSAIGGLGLLAVLSMATLMLSTFMSNTAAANLLLPIGVSSAALSGSMAPAPLAVTMAMVASLAMALPISTPPNAIAYGRGGLSVRDMALPGAIIGVAGTLLVVLLAPLILRWLGIGN